MTTGAKLTVKRLRDWSLRSKLLATSFLLVVGVTLLVLIVLVVNVRQLRDNAIPEQRAILSLNSLIFDYLSEVREYLLDSEDTTLEELVAIETRLGELTEEYRALARDDDPREVTTAETIRGRLERLILDGYQIMGLQQRIRETLGRAEAAERDLIDFGGSASPTPALVTHSYYYLSEVREYLANPQEGTFAEIAEIEAALTSEARTANPAARARVTKLVETGRAVVRLRQELNVLLKNIETIEQELSAELVTANAIAREEVAEASRTLILCVFATGLAGLVLAAVLAVPIANRVTRPLAALRDASRRFAAGELDARAPVIAADEVGRLSESFNQMAAEIERLICDLRQAKDANEQRLEELTNTQSQLVQSGKMAAVGELAAGVAHELNNPLSVVLTYSILLHEKLDRASEQTRDQLAGFAERLDLIKTASERCKTIVSNLLVFSRQDDAEISRVDAADLLARTFELIGSQLRRHQIRLRIEVEEGLAPIRGNFSQLQQVLTNLAINAQQAMESGGELHVAVRRQGAECEITVTDTGAGIPHEHRSRIFEPFFTTKPGGQGTGLGLAIAYGIVRRHRGEIAVDSVVGQGTSFRIRLPFADREEVGT